MRIAIISDTHGNSHALEAVEEHIAKVAKPDMVCCAGDLVNYGAHSSKVIERTRALCSIIVRGNHDEAVANSNFDFRKWKNPAAESSALITRNQLSTAEKQFLLELPTYAVIPNTDIRIVHGAPPNDYETYTFDLRYEEILDLCQQTREKVIFVGHSHRLELRTCNPWNHEYLYPYSPSILPADSSTIVNVGSVGQPRDHVNDMDAKYVTFETENLKLTPYTVPYDRLAAAQAIIDAGYPEKYATRLLLPNEESQLRM